MTTTSAVRIPVVRIVIVTLLVALGGMFTGFFTKASPTAGTTYYLSASGSDSNAGTSVEAPWRSLAKLKAAVLNPGDSVGFRKGDTWSGGVVVVRSGTASSVITLTSYGTGDLPTVTGGETGTCFLLSGSFVQIDGLRASACGYSGFSVDGDHNAIRNSAASNNAAGIKVGAGSDFGSYSNNVLTGNNVMNVNTPGANCATATALNCTDDSGAFGVLINGDDNEFSWNTVTGSRARSHDFGHDGAAFEIYNGNGNRIHHNTAIDNNVFSEIGRSAAGTADGNIYRYNAIRSSCGADCSGSGGLIARGPGSSFGPTNDTVFEFNTVWLNGSRSRAVVCHADCPASTVIRGNILVANAYALWLDGAGWTEQANVINGPSNIVPDPSSTTAPALFVNAPDDLRLTPTSPAIDRAAGGTSGPDLGRVQVPQNGHCTGTGAADAGAYEYDPPIASLRGRQNRLDDHHATSMPRITPCSALFSGIHAQVSGPRGVWQWE
jgi:hypothetical protein